MSGHHGREVTETQAAMASEKEKISMHGTLHPSTEGSKRFTDATIEHEKVSAQGVCVSRTTKEAGDGTSDSGPSHVDLTFAGVKRVQNIKINQAKNVVMNGNMTINVGSVPKKKIKKPTKALTESQEHVTRDQILELYEKIGASWKDLGRRLNLDEHELDAIHAQYHYNLPEVSYQILWYWLQREEQPTVAKLAQAFAKMRRGDLADKLAD